MRGDLGMCDLGLLSYEPVIFQIGICRIHGCEDYLLLVSPLVHINIGIETLFLLQCKSKINLFSLSLGCVEANYKMCDDLLWEYCQMDKVDKELVDI
jgi:hypothetical protein